MSDANIQVLPNSTGAKVDTSEVTQAGGSVVERQRVNLSDPSDPNAHARVSGEADRGALGVRAVSTNELLERILDELQAIKQLLLTVASQ